MAASIHSPRRGHTVVERLDHAGRLTLAGGLAGLVAIGIGSRGAMRVVALTSGHIGDLTVRPESGAIPGTIGLAGTAFLLLGGMFVGAAVGLAVLAGLGRWMPADERRRWWLTAALATAVPAVGLLDPANHDFRLFGPTWLAIGLFAALPVGFAALLASWAPRLLRWEGGRLARSVRVLLGLAGLLATAIITLGIGAGEARALLPLPALVLLAVVVGPHAATDRSSMLARVGRLVVPVLAAVATAVTAWRVVAVALA